MLSIIIILIVIAIDQLSKIACADALKLGESIEIIKGVFSIAYVENRGAAFGMLQNAQVFFIIKEYKRMHTAMRISLALIFAGALGNFIDRVALGYVRDMLYFKLIDFPVFNVADSAICIGAAILIIDVLFFKGKTFIDSLDKKKNTDSSEEKE